MRLKNSIKLKKMKNLKIDMRKIEKKLKQDKKLEKYIIQKLKMKN